MTDPKVDPSAVETEFDALDSDPEPALPGQRVYLVVSREGGGRDVIDLDEGAEVTFGRVPECSVAVDDARVSRRHTRIFRSGGQLTVEDLGSRNGTRLNKRVLKSEGARASGGDVVRLGPIEIVIATGLGDAETSRRTTSDDDDDDEIRVGDVVVADPSMKKVFEIARKLGKTQTSVLILGETGVGKEVVASEIHRASERASGPFVRINCASLPESIQESELFGYERGAFTGADRRKLGLFEAANKGTLLLDEIGEMSPKMQAKLLLVLENRTVTRLGSTAEVPVDVRLLSATHRDLRLESEQGRFRQDLFYRISTFTLAVPPLRERPSEISLLSSLFLKKDAGMMQVPVPAFSPEATQLFERYTWPGNVRELKNAVEHALVLSDGETILPEHLPPTVRGLAGHTPKGALRHEVANLEKKNIEAALEAEGGNQTRAARRLGISRRALLYKMEKYSLAK
jgi:transcriptional regulator with PAS, ATPase and Fis domain